MKSLVDLQGKLKGMRVFVALGADVNVRDGQIVEGGDWRLKQAMPTLQFLLREGARIVAINKIGRPDGKHVPGLSNRVLVEPLQTALGVNVQFIAHGETHNPQAQSDNGQLILLDNVRFDPYEWSKDNKYNAQSDKYAQGLARHGELFVFDAFNYAHRNSASAIGVPKLLPTYPGLQYEKEVKTLLKGLNDPEKPLCVIIGGIKVETKILVLQNFLSIADHICLGGVLANTILQMQGVAVGKSIVDNNARQAIEGIDLTDTHMHLPVDTIVDDDSASGKNARVAPVGKLNHNELVLDIGPDTIELFEKIVSQSSTIIWNGPMGKSEISAYANGTIGLAKAIAQSPGFSILGGGDTISFLHKQGIVDGFDHLSTGGGAMLELLAKRTLPTIEAIEQSQQKFGII